MLCYNCMNEKGDAIVCPYCNLDHSAEPAPHHLRPGTVLCGKYVVGYAIGEGGFGITYIGRDLTLDIRIAVKEFYPAGYSNRNSFVASDVKVAQGKQLDFFRKGKERFLTEARNIAKFSSEPGIVDVRDYFEANGTAYIIMEYLDGMDLNRYLNACGTMPAQQAVELMLPVMRSLEKINAAGVIHRDISPDNIMCLKDGTVKLMDFGSARHYASTETEMSVMLKQGYSPEEQYRKSGQQGPWTDVYGVCATLYRMITGMVPPDGLDRMHHDTLKRPSELGIEISPALEQVLLYGLAVFSENRCRSMTELIALFTQAIGKGKVQIAAPSSEEIRAKRVAEAAAGSRRVVTRRIPDHRSYGDSYTAAAAPVTREEEKKSLLAPILIIIITALVLAAGAVGFILWKNSNKNSGSSSSPAPTQETAAPTQAPAPTFPPTEARVQLTSVVGERLDRALTTLKAQGFDVSIEYVSSDGPENVVVSQSPRAGTMLEKGATVILFIPEERPTDPPTEAPPTEDDSSTYVNMGIDGAWFHKADSRLSECFEEVIAYGEEVQFLNRSSGEFMKVRYHGEEGWVLAKYLKLKAVAQFAEPIYDREYHTPVVCTGDTALYDSFYFIGGITIAEGEEAVLVGYCRTGTWNGNDYCELYYRDRVYYLTYSDLRDNFEEAE